MAVPSSWWSLANLGVEQDLLVGGGPYGGEARVFDPTARRPNRVARTDLPARGDAGRKGLDLGGYVVTEVTGLELEISRDRDATEFTWNRAGKRVGREI